MANGIPVRLSVDLTLRARTAAEVLDRSLTQQVEHWARLGQVVESAIQAATVERLKARSYDPHLSARLALATTAEGRAKAAALILERNAIRHGVGPSGRVVRASRSRKLSKNR